MCLPDSMVTPWADSTETGQQITATIAHIRADRRVNVHAFMWPPILNRNLARFAEGQPNVLVLKMSNENGLGLESVSKDLYGNRAKSTERAAGTALHSFPLDWN